jgi:hypothetical protein
MDIEAALSKLIDDRDFIEIDESRNRFNIFDALGAQRGELRHSNFLRFLLSPSAPHGLGARPLQKILRLLLDKLPSEQRPVSSLEVAISDLDDTVVYRELDYIDILAVNC